MGFSGGGNNFNPDGVTLEQTAGGTSRVKAGTADYALATNSAGTDALWKLLVNANIDPAAAIAYSKLNLAGSLVNADISNAAAIAYAKLNLSASIVNADVAAAAAIAYSKLNLANSIVNADIAAAAAVAVSKLGAGTAGQVLLNNATPTPTWTSFSGDVTTNSSGVTAIGASKVVASMLSVSNPTAAQLAGLAAANFGTSDQPWVKIGEATTTAASSVSFASIASGYKVFWLRGYLRSGSATPRVAYVQFNNDTVAGNYNTLLETHTAGSAPSDSNQTGTSGHHLGDSDVTSGQMGILDFYAFNFNSANVKNQCHWVLRRHGAGVWHRGVGFWNNTTEVNRVDVLHTTDNFQDNSYFALYGLKI